MKITAFAIGSYGDFLPILSLGKELKSRGHQVTIATFEEFKSVCEDSDLIFKKISGNSKELVSLLLGNSKNTRSEGIGGIAFLLNKYPELFMQFNSACISSDLIIYTLFGALSYHFAEKYKIPLVRSFVFPFDPTTKFCSLVNKAKRNSISSYIWYYKCYIFFNMGSLSVVNEWRKKLGLGKWNIFRSYRNMNRKKIITLYQYDTILAERDKNWSEHIFITGVWRNLSLNRTNNDKEKIDNFFKRNKNIVYVGFGSMVYDDMKKLFEMVLCSILELDKDISVVISGSDFSFMDTMNDEDKFRVLLVDYIDFNQYMHKFRAAIHHGGNGTVHCCLEFGVPQLIFAFGADQLFWGQQCYELGIGPSPIYVKNKLNMDEIKEKVNELINMEKYKENSGKLKKYITKDGVKVAANIIEKKFKVGNNKDERRNK